MPEPEDLQRRWAVMRQFHLWALTHAGPQGHRGRAHHNDASKAAVLAALEAGREPVHIGVQEGREHSETTICRPL